MGTVASALKSGFSKIMILFIFNQNLDFFISRLEVEVNRSFGSPRLNPWIGQ